MLRAAAALAIAAAVLALTGTAAQVDRSHRKGDKLTPRTVIVPAASIMVDEERPFCDADGVHERCA